MTGRFPDGVASGDPTEDGVVLWTRLASWPAGHEVRWEVAADEAFTDVVASGRADVLDGMDGTDDADDADGVDGTDAATVVRQEVSGLPSGSWLWYRFRCGDDVSVTGRTRTLAAAATVAEPGGTVRLGLTCCARYPSGPFSAYRVLAEADPDLVVHLGDYIYEDGAGGRRGPHQPPHECRTAADYDARYQQYRRDPDLQGLHRRAPWVAMWDDHELDDNAWRTGSPTHADDRAGRWPDRMAAATSTYHRWMAQRPHGNGPSAVDRHLRLGGLVDILLVDTRLAGRSRPAGSGGPVVGDDDDRARTLLSEAQWRWLDERLAAADAPWVIVCSQVMCSPMRFLWVPQLRRDGRRLPTLRLRPWINPDQWDGYPAERDRLLALLDRHARHDVLIVSGDLHAHFVTGIRHRGRVVPELTTPAVSSPTMAELARRRAPLPARVLERWLRLLNRPARSVDLRRHGASVVDVTTEHLTVETRWVDGRGADRARWRLRRGGDGRWERQA